MTDNQSNYLNMGNAAVAHLDKNSTIFAANTKATTLLTGIKTTISSINTVAITQGLDTSGATTAKKLSQNTAIDQAEHIAVGMQAYADDINDSVLAAQVHYTHSDFTHGSVAEITNRMQTLHDKAGAVLIANLAPFNIIAADITNFQTAINNFKTAAPVKTNLRSESKAATAALNPLFKTLRTQFTKMDKLIKTYKVAQPTFVAGYINNRKIINLGKTQQTEELHLMPHHFEAIFGKKFAEGDTFTVRNHSDVPVHVALSDVPTEMPTDIVVEIPPQQEFKLAVSADFGGKFRHWLMIHNFNDLDDTHITIILAHGKSQSSAQAPGQTA